MIVTSVSVFVSLSLCLSLCLSTHALTHTTEREARGQVVYTARVCWTKGWSVSWVGCSGMAWDFILCRMAHNLKLTDCLFLEIFHSVFLDCGWPWVTETVESGTMSSGRLLYCCNISPWRMNSLSMLSWALFPNRVSVSQYKMKIQW